MATVVIMIIAVIIIRVAIELRVLITITLLFQICVNGVCGVAGLPVQSHAVVESGSATDGRWPPLQEPTVEANRHRARAATRDFAQVQLEFVLYSL